MKRACAALLLVALSVFAASPQKWKVNLQPPPVYKANMAAPIRILVNNEKGSPIGGADVKAVLTGTAGMMDETTVSAAQVKPGNYEATITFPSAGEWNIEVRVNKGASGTSRTFHASVSQ